MVPIFLSFFLKSNIRENHTFKVRICHHFLLFDVLSSETGETYSVTPNVFFGATAISIRAGHHRPGEEKKKRGAMQKGETIFDIPGMALRPWEGGRTYSMCVCLCKWLLCSSDNATAPAGARGYGWVGGWRWICDWLMCCAILSDTESPFTIIVYWCPEGRGWRMETPAR